MKIQRFCLPILAAALAVLVAVDSASAQRRARRTTAEVSPEQTAKLLEVMKLGDTAKDIEFQPVLREEKVKLSELTKDGPVVLVVLRGFPGYQCPICSRLVGEMREKAEDFTKLGAKVVLIYPGPGPLADLREKAKEFLEGTELPKPFYYMVDPEYAFTNAYELRWDAESETAYPSTFVLDTKRVVKFRKISQTHGDRAPTAEVLASLTELQKAAQAAPAAMPETKAGI